MKIPDLVRAGLIGLKTVYVLVNSNGQIIEHDSLFPSWIMAEQDPAVGMDLFEVLPEFVGQEAVLNRVRSTRAALHRSVRKKSSDN